MDDEIVDLTCPTPTTDRSASPLLIPISLLTPETSKRASESTSETARRTRLTKRRKDDNAVRGENGLDVDGGTTSPITDSLRKYIARRRGLLPTAESRHPTSQSPPSLLPQLRQETEFVPSQGIDFTNAKDAVYSSGVDGTVEWVGELSLKKTVEAAVPARRLLFRGKDDVVIELSEDLQRSFMTTALIRMLDEMQKEEKETFTTFCCRRHASLLPGRRCITWLKKIKHPTTTATHEHLPYLLLLLEVKGAGYAPFLSKIHSGRGVRDRDGEQSNGGDDF